MYVDLESIVPEIVAVRVEFTPGVTESDFGESVSFSAVGSVTVTEHVAVLVALLCAATVTVIMDVPTFLAVIVALKILLESGETVATDESLEDQLTVVPVTLVGVTVAVKLAVVLLPPKAKESELWLSVTPVRVVPALESGSAPAANADGTIEQTIAITRSRDSNLRLMFFISFSFPSFLCANGLSGAGACTDFRLYRYRG